MFDTFKKFIAWWPVIKQDVDYDATSLYPILRFKLKQLYDAIDASPIEGKDEELFRIMYCIRLCDQLQADSFCEEEFKKLDDKYGKIEIKTEPVSNSKNLRAELIRPKAITEEEKAQERKEFNEVCDLEEKRRKKAILSLFLTIANNHRKWWY